MYHPFHDSTKPSIKYPKHPCQKKTQNHRSTVDYSVQIGRNIIQRVTL